MTEQQLNDVWAYIQTEPMESAIITDSEGFAVGYIVGTGVDPKKSAEELAWRIVADHNLNLLATHAVQGDATKQIVYVLLRGGLSPNIFTGVFATSEGAHKAREEWRKEHPDLRFTIVESEVGND